MTAFLALLADEVRTQLRRPGPHLFAALYAAVGVLIMVVAGGGFESVRLGVGSGNVKVDSPLTITVLALVCSLFLTMNVAAIAGSAACRDVEDGSHALVYSTPVRKGALLGARFLAALLTAGWIALWIPIGLLVGAALPLLEAERTGSWTVLSGVVAWGAWVLPTLVATSALFFGLAAVTRRMFPNYIGGVLLLVGYLAAQALMADVENDALAAALDPFGMAAFDYLTRYWSPFQSNTEQVWPVGLALANRLGVMAIGFGAFGLGAGLARLDQHGWQLSLRRSAPAADEPRPLRSVPVPRASRRFDGRARWLQGWALTRRALGDVLGHRYFWAFVGASVLFQLLNSQVIGTLYGTETWPVTYQVLEVLEGTLGVFLLLVLTFYAGDLVWHERDLRASELYDATPTPDALPLLAKGIALGAVVIGLHATVLVVGVGVQLAAGYTHLELGLYAQWLLSSALLRWLPTVALALAVHAVVDAKWVGHFLLVGFYVLRGFRGALGFEYNLPWFGSDPGRVWSDMNGWGPYLVPFLAYRALWLAVAGALLVVARLAWVRGTERGWGVRAREARRRLDRGTRVALVGALAVAAMFAGWIAVETSWIGTYRSTVAETRLQVAFERTYKAEWERAPQPRVADVRLWVELFPQTRVVSARGLLDVENRAAEPVTRLFVTLPSDTEVRSLTLDRAIAREERDVTHGVWIWTLAAPLLPGERALLSFATVRTNRGWPNDGARTEVVRNGSFVPSALLVPALGYDRNRELAEKAERRKYDLPPRPRMLDPDDPLARGRNYVGPDGDLVRADLTVTTDAGQIALAPGELVASGERDGRAWFHYRPAVPILHFTSFLSGRWEVRRDRWRDVALEVYYDPRHAYNVDRMVTGMQRSLEKFSTVFSPFQYKTLRIVEFPRYAQFAQSFPSTVPYSESIGFIARIGDPEEDIDYVYYVTAHETAHQWWAHQLVGADAQGSTVLSETLAQYSALEVMFDEYGADQIHRFLGYEADRYFSGRATEIDRELPLVQVEDQPYVHYAKGSVVMWGIREVVGPERLQAAIRGFLERWRGRAPPYPTARDFVDHLKRELPEARQAIEEGFDRIVLFDDRVDAATKRENADGTWTVTLSLAVTQTVADEIGAETEVPFDREVEIGVFAGTDARREALHLARHRVVGPQATVEVVVDREPTLAGVDPNLLLLDRNRDDNVVALD